MKSTIKIIIIFGIATSFLSVYPMAKDRYVVFMEKKEAGTWANRSVFCQLYDSNELGITRSLSETDPLYKNLHSDGSLDLGLKAIAFFGAYRNKDGKDLEKIRKAVREGIPLVFKYVIKSAFSSGSLGICISISPSEEDISIFTLIENFFENAPSFLEHSIQFRPGEAIEKKRRLMEAIDKGHRERQKKFDRERDKLINFAHDGLGIEIPDVMMSIVCSFLPDYYINAESTKLIREAKQKFYKEHQVDQDSELQIQLDSDEGQCLQADQNAKQYSQPNPDGTYKKIIKKIIGYIRKNPRQTGLVLATIPILCYFLINLRR